LFGSVGKQHRDWRAHRCDRYQWRRISSDSESSLKNQADHLVWIEVDGRCPHGLRTGICGTKKRTVADARAMRDETPLIKAVSSQVDDRIQSPYSNRNWGAQCRC